MTHPVSQPDALKQMPAAGCGICSPGELERQHHIFERSHLREQLKRLKDETDMRGTPCGARVFVERKKILIGSNDLA